MDLELTLKELPKKSFKHLEQHAEALGSCVQDVFINLDLEFYFPLKKK